MAPLDSSHISYAHGSMPVVNNLAGVRHTTKALVVLLAALIEVVHGGLGRLVPQPAVVAVTQEGEQRQEVTVGLNIEISICWSENI